MDNPVLLDEFHLKLYVPADLDETRVRAASRLLDRPRFRARLVRAIYRLLDRTDSLRPLAIEVTR